MPHICPIHFCTLVPKDHDADLIRLVCPAKGCGFYKFVFGLYPDVSLDEMQ